jgi:hypothetical protein
MLFKRPEKVEEREGRTTKQRGERAKVETR